MGWAVSLYPLLKVYVFQRFRGNPTQEGNALNEKGLSTRRESLLSQASRHVVLHAPQLLRVSAGRAEPSARQIVSGAGPTSFAASQPAPRLFWGEASLACGQNPIKTPEHQSRWYMGAQNGGLVGEWPFWLKAQPPQTRFWPNVGHEGTPKPLGAEWCLAA